ncbi:hypothetical protein J2787_003270 [Chryseobacterium rhizosphaerae]|uniref:Tail fiber domain-containing protein n=1 Tax=Chryseobacterium rhizosphaerae TaxID=395937 RepID=A0AAE3Y9B0_9FLAO|nr:hypothetical protein [Chryseobacterium rhizosphaerae]MDR6527878.1 hypothetical protein [Chryseobacterium rhizosphaerae]
MAKKNKQELKEYFKAGKRPTESQFEDFIDSYVHADESSEYFTSVEFPANYKVGDYIEFLQFEPASARAAGFFEVSIAYTRNNTASAATHIAAVSHANPDIWRESGTVNKNNYVDGAENNNLTVDINGGICRFRLRALRTYGATDQKLKVFIKVRSVNKNEVWTKIDNRGNSLAAVPLQPMTNEWNVWVGNLNSAETAKIGLKVNAQGNVGIGTANPETKLNVVHENSLNQNSTIAKFTANGATGGSNIVSLSYHSKANLELNSGFSGLGRRYGDYFDFNIENDNSYDPNFGSINLVTSQNVQMTVRPNGNVGIGTVNPLAKLDVVGGVNIAAGFPIQLAGHASSHGLKYKRYNSDNSLLDGPFLYGWTGGALGIKKDDNEFNVLTWKESGNVAVQGKVEAKDFVVSATPTADHVFAADYNLREIGDLEKFISEKSHLPEIPSAKEMTDSGLSVGDFQIKLLQKIEELTLYMISMKKEIDVLKSN